MKARLLFFLFAAFAASMNAGAQQLTTFHRGYYDTLSYAIPFGGGNYIASDVAEMPNGDFLAALNYGIMRTDNVGKPKWVMSYSAPGAISISGYPNYRQVVFSQVLPLPGGDAILLAAIKGNVSASRPDTAMVCRVNASGTISWCRTLTAPAPQSLQARGMTLTANGELLVCMFSNFSPSVIGDYTVVMRMSLSGSVIWQRYLINNSTGTFNRQFRSWDVSECSNGDFLISGFGNVPDSNLVARFTSTGVVRWVKSYQCGGMTRRAFQRIRELPGGKIAVAVGEVYPRYGNAYVQLDSMGNLGGLQKAFKDSFYYGNSFIQPNGDIVFAARNFMYKVSNAGSVAFAHHYLPPTQYGVNLGALCTTADGGYAAGGSYPAGTGRYNGYLVKTDASGAAPPYSDNFAPSDTPCNCRVTSTAITDTALSFPVSDVALTSTNIYMQDTLFALTLNVPHLAFSGTSLIYPNPAKDVIYFSGNSALNAAIYSSEGKLLIMERAVSRLDVSGLPAGVYFILLKDKEGTRRGLQPFVKE